MTHRARPSLARVSLLTLPLLSLLALIAGCGAARLETGYQPRALGSTEDQRKGYYAGPFSPEAQAVQREGGNGGVPRGPGAGPGAGTPGR